MNSVQRTRGIKRMIRVFVFRKPVQKYFTSGDRACGRMMREARSEKRKPAPSDSAILAWARFRSFPGNPGRLLGDQGSLIRSSFRGGVPLRI